MSEYFKKLDFKEKLVITSKTREFLKKLTGYTLVDTYVKEVAEKLIDASNKFNNHEVANYCYNEEFSKIKANGRSSYDLLVNSFINNIDTCRNNFDDTEKFEIKSSDDQFLSLLELGDGSENQIETMGEFAIV